MNKSNEFINKAVRIHGNKYDYSKVVYINSKKKVCIICPKHGEFYQAPHSHLSGKGCKYCGIENRVVKQRNTTQDFIFKAKSIHGDYYDYSKVDYINWFTKVEIICPVHGSFYQIPNNHLEGYGCKKCALFRVSKSKRVRSSVVFINKALRLYDNKYSYDEVNYINSKTKVKINCRKHGYFYVEPYKHLQGQVCPKCKPKSKYEEDLFEFVKTITHANVVRNSKILDCYELDIYIEDVSLAIEFNGLYWHSDLFLCEDYHRDKSILAFTKGIYVIHIWEDEWLLLEDNIKDKLKTMLSACVDVDDNLRFEFTTQDGYVTVFIQHYNDLCYIIIFKLVDSCLCLYDYYSFSYYNITDIFSFTVQFLAKYFVFYKCLISFSFGYYQYNLMLISNDCYFKHIGFRGSNYSLLNLRRSSINNSQIKDNHKVFDAGKIVYMYMV